MDRTSPISPTASEGPVFNHEAGYDRRNASGGAAARNDNENVDEYVASVAPVTEEWTHMESAVTRNIFLDRLSRFDELYNAFLDERSLNQKKDISEQ